MTQLELMESAAATLERSAGHAQKLIDGLAGNPQAWEFTGDVIDAGPGATMSGDPPRCACGHPIRYQYIVSLPEPLGLIPAGERRAIGSECIKHFEEIAPEAGAMMRAKAEELAELAKAGKREAKRNMDCEKGRAAIREFLRHREPVLARYLADMDAGRMSPRPVFIACRRYTRGLKAYKSLPAMVRECERLTALWSEARREAGIAPQEPSEELVLGMLDRVWGD